MGYERGPFAISQDLAWGAMLEAPPQKVQPKVKVAPPQPEPESVPPKVRMGKVYAEEDNGTSEVPAKKIQSSASRSSGNSRAARAISPRTA
ncbi:unnamed protein product [Effrenium voratum]|nr:unnamed protein product [Effrenium voratum]